MNRSARSIASTLAIACALLAGCAVAPSRDDPFEQWNRAMYSVHQAVDSSVIKPIAEGYVKATPQPVRTGVSNFFGNIDDLFTGINHVLQGKKERAGDDFGRVLLNSTFGIGGILDLASTMGIAKDKTDFGITFGKWGAAQGPYFFIPLFGPTTVRDGAGWLVRIYTRAQLLSAEGVLDAAALDKYRYLRNAYLRARRYQVYEGKPPPEEEE